MKFSPAQQSWRTPFPIGIYLFKLSHENTRTTCVIWSKLTIKINDVGLVSLMLNSIYMHGSHAQFSKSYMHSTFSSFTVTCFFACVYDRYDVANSNLLQTFKFVTIKFKTMLLEFLYLRSLVVSDLRSETKGSRFQFGCNLCAEVLSL